MEKKLLVRVNSMNVYEDGTYRCDHWDANDCSEWKIEDGMFKFKHNTPFSTMEDFVVQEGMEEDAIEEARIIDRALQNRLTEEIEKTMLS
jgi:hypothetical protein